jgi:hypothetical protein
MCKNLSSLEVVLKLFTKQFQNSASFVKLLQVIECFGRAEERFLCWTGTKIRKACVGESSIELLGFEEGERSVPLDNFNLTVGRPSGECTRVTVPNVFSRRPSGEEVLLTLL